LGKRPFEPKSTFKAYLEEINNDEKGDNNGPDSNNNQDNNSNPDLKLSDPVN